MDGRNNLVAARVSADQPGWLTEDGIVVGMAVVEAEAILGDRIVEGLPHAYVDGEYPDVRPEDIRYMLETDVESITAVHAGMEPVVSYTEGCS
ncbi:MAG: hypothetical protein GEU79_17715 [Acidimicrobiia bacterium]|nr:hypothetical protein [Acidimicrobiia bacterium]